MINNIIKNGKLIIHLTMNEDDLNTYDYSDEDVFLPDDYLSSINKAEGSSLKINNGWNKQMEHDARVIGERSGGLRWMHNKASSVFLKRYWLITGVNIVLGAIVVAFNSNTGS